MLKFRTADFHYTKTQDDRLYYSAGIPRGYWCDLVGNPIFKPLNKENSALSLQSSLYKKLFSSCSIFLENNLIFIGSDNEQDALKISYEVMKKAVKCNYKIQITNACKIKEEKIIDETVYMLHNVFDSGTIERYMHIRDWVSSHEDSFRIVAIAGNPMSVVDSCRLAVNSILYINSIGSNETKSFV